MRYRGGKNEADTWWLPGPTYFSRFSRFANVCHAANGLLHNLKVALLDNVDIYGDCSEFNTGAG